MMLAELCKMKGICNSTLVNSRERELNYAASALVINFTRLLLNIHMGAFFGNDRFKNRVKLLGYLKSPATPYVTLDNCDFGYLF